MAEDDLLGVVVELAESDKAAALLHDLGSARNLEPLRIGEDAGVLFLDQDALLAPGN
jgi:HD superfamily phosphodiesterase